MLSEMTLMRYKFDITTVCGRDKGIAQDENITQLPLFRTSSIYEAPALQTTAQTPFVVNIS